MIVFVILTIEVVAGTLILMNASEAAVFVEKSMVKIRNVFEVFFSIFIFQNIYRYPCTEEQQNSTLGQFCGGNVNDDLEVTTDEELRLEQNSDWIDRLIKHDWKESII